MSDAHMNASPNASPLSQDRRREIRIKRSGFERTRFPQASPRQTITYKLATTKDELEAAFRLVYRAYVGVGLQASNEVGLRFSKYHLLPSTKVLLAIHRPELNQEESDFAQVEQRKKIVGTLTLVLDSQMGLPMEAICKKTVETFRQAGRKPAEVVALAIHPRFRGINNTLRLFRLMAHYARHGGVTDLGASVTQRHERFYRDMLLFTPVGEKLAYANANGLQAQGYFLDATTFPENYRNSNAEQEFDCNLVDFFNEGRPKITHDTAAWTEDAVRYFLSLCDSVRQTLSPDDLELLRRKFRLVGKHFPY